MMEIRRSDTPDILATATKSRDGKFWICDWCKRKTPITASSDTMSMLGKHDPGCKAVSRIKKAIEAAHRANRS
jgi:hypothetical protein